MRLDKFIASQRTDLSRNAVKVLVRKGAVTVDGVKAEKADMHIDENTAVVAVRGEEIVYKKYIYLMMNKPQGVVCSTKDGESQTVLELVPPHLMREGLFPAGRLDKDTEGFVFLTDDGALAHKMLSPKSHVPKTYFVRLERPWQEDYEQIMSKGMTIPPEKAGSHEEKCLPAQFKGSGENHHECTLTIHEGKYHQVKRMFAALGNRVVYLKRISIGGMALDESLPLGETLEILHKDVEKILTENQPVW